MPQETGTLTDDDVAARLGVAVDPMVSQCTEAARQYVFDRRSIMFADPAQPFNALIWEGAVQWAVLEYQKRSAPQGFDGVDVFGATPDTSFTRWDIDRMIGADQVTA